MKKIIIFGNSGAGKSTLARKLQYEYNIQHLDLDSLAWADAAIPTRKSFKESKREIDGFLSGSTGWVVEGCYADLLKYIANQANELIFLNPGTEICIKRCLERPWEPHKYKSKQEQDKNLDMLIKWVNEYEYREDEFSFKEHKELFESFQGKKLEVN